MANQFEIAHRTPSRTRLRWRGDEAQMPEIVRVVQSDPSVRGIDYRQATGSLVLVHGSDFGMDRLERLVQPLQVEVLEEPQEKAAAKRWPRHSNGAGPSAKPSGSSPKSTDAAQLRSGATGKWSPIVAEVEAVVLFGLILGWIRDWFAGRSLALSTVILLLVTGVALVIFWLHRRRKDEVQEQELEFIYA